MDKRQISAIRDGYSFLRIGQLQQTLMDIIIEACRRFGAEKAESVISTALYDGDKSEMYILTEVKEETGLSISQDDLEFLGRVARAQQSISEALKILQEA